MVCAFCEDKLLESRKILENDYAQAFLSNMPIVPGHILIVPKRCVRAFAEMNTAEREAVFDLKLQLRERLLAKGQAEGFNFAWNEGELAGQTVAHFHLHLLPRKIGDKGIVEYEPRKFLYRPEVNREVGSAQELADYAKYLRDLLK